MKVFSMALLGSALIASLASVTEAKARTFETNAYVTPKRQNNDEADPYLKQNMLNLRQRTNDILDEHLNDFDNEDLNKLGDAMRSAMAQERNDFDNEVAQHIVTTSDIDNYFNLQITTQLFFGSN